MANYIQSNILCQAYIRIENPKVGDSELEGLRVELIQYIERRSRFILYPEVSADVLFRSGSLVEYLTIAGSLYSLLQAYPKFREGVAMLYGDAKRLADSMILEAQFASKARTSDVSRAEARTGVIGSLKALIDGLDKIRDGAGTVRVESLSDRIQNILEDTTKLLDLLHDPRDVGLVSEHLKEILLELPLAPLDPKGVRPSKKSLMVYEKAIRDFLKLLDDRTKRIEDDAAQVLLP